MQEEKFISQLDSVQLKNTWQNKPIFLPVFELLSDRLSIPRHAMLQEILKNPFTFVESSF